MQSPRIRLLEELAVFRVRNVLVGKRFVHPVIHDLCRRIVTEEVIDGCGHFEGALVAMVTHGLHPAWVDYSGSEYASSFLVQGAGSHGVRAGGVAHIRLGGGTRQRANSGNHAAVELEVVIGIGDIVLTGIGILRGDLNTAVGRLHILSSLFPIDTAAVGVAAPGRVNLC